MAVGVLACGARQFIATSAEVAPKGYSSLVRESYPKWPKHSGFTINWPDMGVSGVSFFSQNQLHSRSSTARPSGSMSNLRGVQLLMEEILHHLECINLVNNGINYQPQLVSRMSSINSISKTKSLP